VPLPNTLLKTEINSVRIKFQPLAFQVTDRFARQHLRNIAQLSIVLFDAVSDQDWS
jgi:hypothetical protein